MGDEILKNIAKILLFSSLVLSSSFSLETNHLDMSEYDKLFSEISSKRVGISQNEIKKVKDPFILEIARQKLDGNVTTEKAEPTYDLHAIFGNKAKINDKWYAINEELGYYKLTKIKKASVLLTSASDTKELFIRKYNASNIQFSSK